MLASLLAPPPSLRNPAGHEVLPHRLPQDCRLDAAYVSVNVWGGGGPFNAVALSLRATREGVAHCTSWLCVFMRFTVSTTDWSTSNSIADTCLATCAQS